MFLIVLDYVRINERLVRDVSQKYPIGVFDFFVSITNVLRTMNPSGLTNQQRVIRFEKIA